MWGDDRYFLHVYQVGKDKGMAMFLLPLSTLQTRETRQESGHIQQSHTSDRCVSKGFRKQPDQRSLLIVHFEAHFKTKESDIELEEALLSFPLCSL